MIKNKKIVAMVPARVGSKRIYKKNIRLIDNKPLVSYVIETLNKTNIFDDIYLNADDVVFEKIAKEYNVKYYDRNKNLSTDKSTNDEFALDFMNNINADILIQILPTSPLITVNEIECFAKRMIGNNCETLISVEHKQIGSVYKTNPINFDKLNKNPPSQEMEPVKVYATALMGWEYKSFKQNMLKHGCAYHGGSGVVDYFELNGISTLDIDNEDDFLLAEAIINAKKYFKPKKISYYGKN